MARDYQVIVIGGGHAGYEAAHAAARRGAKTLLVALDLDRLGLMSCNPAVGGLAKGQMVREVDALGGLIGKIADATAIQFRTLNRGRGPAVRAIRTQNDRALFAAETRRRLLATPNLTMLAGEVVAVHAQNGRVTGVMVGAPSAGMTGGRPFSVARDGGGEIAARAAQEHGLSGNSPAASGQVEISADAVVVACGTFLNGLAHVGMESFPAGRDGDGPARGLSESLIALGIRCARLKTGTPARLDGKSIDYSAFIEQKGDDPPPFFSLETLAPSLPQRSCWLGHSNAETKKIILANLDRSPLYAGKIMGIGPRYCPSIEDKVKRFTQHEIYQIFIEPEGVQTDTVYVNGMSTSLPKDVQEIMLKSVNGLEKCVIEKYGYAIEYDFFPPRQLRGTLESKIVAGLYFAGQVNGTSGYEEAAAQGIVAGINASRRKGEDEFILRRDQAYIGVLIDDLITKGTDEPYRMFTSRAEHRLSLRDDNAYFRLTGKGHELGMVSAERKINIDMMKQQADEVLEYLRKTIINNKIRERFIAVGHDIGEMNGTLESICQRPCSDYKIVRDAMGIGNDLTEKVNMYIESEAKYAGYLEREKRLNHNINKFERIKIPADLDYTEIKNITIEARQKLSTIKPENIGQAARISGVSPADIRVLEIAVCKKNKDK